MELLDGLLFYLLFYYSYFIPIYHVAIIAGSQLVLLKIYTNQVQYIVLPNGFMHMLCEVIICKYSFISLLPGGGVGLCV